MHMVFYNGILLLPSEYTVHDEAAPSFNKKSRKNDVCSIVITTRHGANRANYQYGGAKSPGWTRIVDSISTTA